MHKLCTTTIVLSCGLLFSLCPANASELNDSELSLGSDLASSARYTEAIPHLNIAVQRDPNDAIAHYYLGYCLSSTNQFMKGRTELDKAINLAGTNSAVGQLARQRLSTLQPQPAVSSTNPKAMAINSAVQTIREQAESAKHLQQSNYDGYASNVVETANGRIARLRAAQSQQISSMQNAYITDKWGNSYPVYTQAQIEAERQRYEEKINIVNQESAEQATSVRGQAQALKSGLDSMADELQKQLVDGPTNGSPKLSPVGTNLYVRNYIPGSENKPGARGGNTGPLAATPDKLILEPTNQAGKYASHVVPAGLIADQDKMILQRKQNPGATEKLKVTGRMLHPAVKAIDRDSRSSN